MAHPRLVFPSFRRVKTPADLAALRLPMDLAVVLSAALARGTAMKVGRSLDHRAAWALIAPARGAHARPLELAGARLLGTRGDKRWVLDEDPENYWIGVWVENGREYLSQGVIAEASALAEGNPRTAWTRLQTVQPLLSDNGVTYKDFKQNPEGHLEGFWDWLAGSDGEHIGRYLAALGTYPW